MAPIPISYEFEFTHPGPRTLTRRLNASPAVREAGVVVILDRGRPNSGRQLGEWIAEDAPGYVRDWGGRDGGRIAFAAKCDSLGWFNGSAARDILLNSSTHEFLPSLWIATTDGTAAVESELVTPILPAGPRGDNMVRAVLGAASDWARVGRDSGLHLHVGAVSDHGHLKALRPTGQSARTALYGAPMKKAQVSLCENIAYFQPVIDALVSRSRRGGRNMCGGALMEASPWWLGGKGENPRVKRDFIADKWQRAGGEGGGRYYKVNFGALDRHGTVEFRQHQGTVNAQKAIMWGRICAAFWVRSVNHHYKHLDCRRFSVNVGGMASFLGLGKKTTRFMRRRAREFGFTTISGGDHDRSLGSQRRRR